MATCFRCGKELPHNKRYFRRKVKTGESVLRPYASRGTISVQTRFAMRVVCSACEERLRKDALDQDIRRLIEAVVIVGTLALLIGLYTVFH